MIPVVCGYRLGHFQLGSDGDGDLGRPVTGNDSGGPFDRWIRLVERIRANDPHAIEDLYTQFGKGVRHFFLRQLAEQDVDDKVHDTFLIVLRAIQNGLVRQPARLQGFIRTIAKRQLGVMIDSLIKSRQHYANIEAGHLFVDRSVSIEADFGRREQRRIMAATLKTLSDRDREILVRFYFREQAPEQICLAMKLTPTQYRLLKSRAKGRFTAACHKRLAAARRTGTAA
jgi:RNA polymerase sigma-70 factor, ECF subfamily